MPKKDPSTDLLKVLSDKSFQRMLNKERKQLYCHQLSKINEKEEPSRIAKIYALSKIPSMMMTADSKLKNHPIFNERISLPKEEKVKVEELSVLLKSLETKGENRDQVSRFTAAIERYRALSKNIKTDH
jgi:hypothetical protein